MGDTEEEKRANSGAPEDPKVWETGLQALLSGLTASSSGSMPAVKQMGAQALPSICEMCGLRLAR